VILDRNFDLATPLHHTWTYQALVHDVMVREKEGRWEGEEEEEGGRRWREGAGGRKDGSVPCRKMNVRNCVLLQTETQWSLEIEMAVSL